MEPFQPPRPPGWWGLPDWMRGLVLLGGGLAVVAVPIYFLIRNDRLAVNERAASAALQALASAQADFRGNDRDGNKIQDFWTGDVAGLYGLLDPSGSPLKLIDPAIAAADARPLTPGTPTPYRGYYFAAVRLDETGEPYCQGGKSRNPGRFAICAYPARHGVSGRHTFCVDEGNTVHKLDFQGGPLYALPRNLAAPEKDHRFQD